MTVLLAAALDALLREPPAGVHPVVAMGRWLGAVGGRIPASPPARAAVAGAAAWLLGAASVLASATVLDRAIRRLPPACRGVAGGVALWPLLALGLLVDEVVAVERALGHSLDEGRAAVARLVSRDVAALDATGVREAALESLAENLSDSVVAPLWWYAVGGLPAAAVYRYVNTADAMWGYRTPRWHAAGWAAARADDVANLVPARVTALLLGAPAGQLRAVAREAARTPSPNAGWPMAALALRLGIRLGKPGIYLLNPPGRTPTAADTATAVRLVRARGWLAVAACAAGRAVWAR